AEGDHSVSVEAQLMELREFCDRKGWPQPTDDLVFIDDAKSGAEFNKRPGLNRMRQHYADIDAIVVWRRDRIGRDQVRTPYEISKMTDHGIMVYDCTGRVIAKPDQTA